MAKASEFDLSGRQVTLRELRQVLTYGGVLAGLPTVEMNQRQLERLVADHRGKPGEPCLIPPTEKPIDYRPRDGRPYPFGTPSALPAVTCIGRFHSVLPVRDKSLDYSELVVIWFQDDFAFPIDPAVLAQILAIHWEACAADVEY